MADKVERELRAQIDRALEAGVDVTHLDTHMGSRFLRAIFPVYVQLASDYRVPIFLPRPDPKVLEERGLGEAADAMLTLSRRYEEAGGPVLERFDADSLEFTPGEGEAHNRKRIGNLVPGLNYLVCHAARAGAELTAITPESAHQRDFERSFYGGSRGREALDRAGVQTVGMRALRDLMRAPASS